MKGFALLLLHTEFGVCFKSIKPRYFFHPCLTCSLHAYTLTTNVLSMIFLLYRPSLQKVPIQKVLHTLSCNRAKNMTQIFNPAALKASFLFLPSHWFVFFQIYKKQIICLGCMGEWSSQYDTIFPYHLGFFADFPHSDMCTSFFRCVIQREM